MAFVLVLVAFGAGIAALLEVGSRLPEPSLAANAPPGVPPLAHGAGGWWQPFVDHLQGPLANLLLQVIVIVATARMLGALFARWGQPAVIGEMVAGLLLGPSLAGWLLPGLQAFVFPASGLGPLRMLSQIGVVLFMFVVGIELDLDHLRAKADAAILVSHVGMLFPFLLGSASALLAYGPLAPPGVGFPAFALFLGISMSITAFPVLARILDDRGMARTLVGTTAIAAAAVGDVTAWCALAIVVAIVGASGLTSAVGTIALTGLFVVAMLVVVKPLARRLFSSAGVAERHPRRLVSGVLLLTFASALTTEAIGIHALFGAFLAGVVMPADDGLRRLLKERLETFAAVFLLPLFFAMTGLRTQVGLLSDARGWLLCLGFVAVAVVGKLGGGTLAARSSGLAWLDAFAVGSLMNTRGLVELIVLNIGYDLGILSPQIFAMLVLMALGTTMMTGPLLSLVDHWRRRAAAHTPSA